ncbi:MAG TPA: hypothetical protein VGB55_03680 [Tepidisphaeraceae bacterium]|jgi:hypothetical protein
MSQIEYQSGARRPQDFPDRTTRLLVVGIVLLLVGLCFGCMTAVMPVALATARMQNQPPMATSQVILAMVLYGALTVLGIAVGYGAIVKRRWSRPLGMIVSSHWLVGGILMLIALIAALVVNKGTFPTAANAPVPAGAQMWMAIGALGFTILFAIGLPLTILLLLKPHDVQQTLEYYDATPRWTDRVPLPILGLALTLLAYGLFLLYGGAAGVFSFFGKVLTGLPALAAASAFGLAFLAAGHWVFRLQMRGWQIGFWANILLSLSLLVSALTIDPAAYYGAMGLTPEQVELLARQGTSNKFVILVTPLLLGIGFSIYMLRLRRPLREAAETAAISHMR